MKMKFRNFVVLITAVVAAVALFVGYGLFFKGQGGAPASSVGDASCTSVQDSSSTVSAGEQNTPAESTSPESAPTPEPEDTTQPNSAQSNKENEQNDTTVTPVQSNGTESSVLNFTAKITIKAN